MRGLSGLKLLPGIGGRRGRGRCLATSSASGATASPASRGALGSPLAKAALTSCSMSMLGDCLAQIISRQLHKQRGTEPGDLDVARLARMGGFGLLFYGPYQFYWYRSLDRFFPTRSVPHFLSKVALNQTALAPVVLAVVFSWNLALTGQSSKIPDKIRHSLVPTMVNGWKFWVPAASLNFWAVPLRHQVLYMSTCSVLWTAYLSYASNS